MHAYRSQRGQSMVEFAMMFVVFFFFIFACLSIILWGYNYNILQRAGYEASRQFAIGQMRDIPEVTNWGGGMRKVGYGDTAVQVTLQSQLSNKLLPLPLFQFAIRNVQYSLVRQRNPVPDTENTWGEFVDGHKARISMDYTFGISLGLFGEIVATTPLIHEMYIVRGNDEDRDGRDDTYEGQWADDHDNDGAIDGDTDWVYDQDDDGDGILDAYDTGAIVRTAATGEVWLWTYTWSGAPHMADTQWVATRRITDNRFHVPLWYNSAVFPNQIFPQQVPQNSDCDAEIRVSLKYDVDNDGWQDVYDYAPHDPSVH